MMDVFSGTYVLNVDTTGRFVLPIEFRNRLGHSCVITKGAGCLWLMTTEMSESIMKQLEDMSKGPLASMLNPQINAIQRHIFSGMTTPTPETDKNNRITLTHEQRKFAKIDRSLVLCGVGKFVEIWNPAAKDQNDKKFENEAELFDIGNLLFGITNKENDIS